MKILIFIQSLSMGGAERVTSALANYWAGKGNFVTIVTISSVRNDYYSLAPNVNRIGLDLEGSSSSFVRAIMNNLYRFYSLRRILSDIRPNVALAMMSSANITLAMAVFGIKNIVAIGSERTHPPQIPLGVAWEALRKYLYRRLDAIVALTEESAIWLRKNTQAREVVVIPNAAVWPVPEQEPFASPLAISVEDKTLLAVGRLSEEKGFDGLIRVFKSISNLFPNWTLVIVGDGPRRGFLENLVASLELSERVFFPGRVGNVGHWYTAADIYVLSSSFEGFPNTLLEAMACGLPVVSFDCDTGPRDIIRHEIDGLLVTSSDWGALRNALSRLMGDQTLRASLGKRALDVRDRFSQDFIGDQWGDLFDRLVKQKINASRPKS